MKIAPNVDTASDKDKGAARPAAGSSLAEKDGEVSSSGGGGGGAAPRRPTSSRCWEGCRDCSVMQCLR